MDGACGGVVGIVCGSSILTGLMNVTDGQADEIMLAYSVATTVYVLRGLQEGVRLCLS